MTAAGLDAGMASVPLSVAGEARHSDAPKIKVSGFKTILVFPSRSLGTRGRLRLPGIGSGAVGFGTGAFNDGPMVLIDGDLVDAVAVEIADDRFVVGSA